ncbi:hypothetical protein ABKN59_011719 [Abortiporus biennis]
MVTTDYHQQDVFATAMDSDPLFVGGTQQLHRINPYIHKEDPSWKFLDSNRLNTPISESIVGPYKRSCVFPHHILQACNFFILQVLLSSTSGTVHLGFTALQTIGSDTLSSALMRHRLSSTGSCHHLPLVLVFNVRPLVFNFVWPLKFHSKSRTSAHISASASLTLHTSPATSA